MGDDIELLYSKFHILVYCLILIYMMRIVFTGGGTGGHIFPLIAVSQALRKLTAHYDEFPEFWYCGSSSEYWTLLANQGIGIKNIASSKFRRYLDMGNIIDIPKFFISIVQAFWKLFWLMPDIVFSKGGSGSIPVVLAAVFYRIPVIVHESDSIPSLTTKITARYASRVAFSFETSTRLLHAKARAALTGNPVREVFFTRNTAKSQEDLKRELGFEIDKPLILFLGGSQGASSINDFVVDNIELLLKKFQILHQTGPLHYKNIEEEINSILKNTSGILYKYKGFGLLDGVSGDGAELSRVMRGADIIVSRSGSGALFEIAALGKPAILIPLPSAAADHQRHNAYEYIKTGAALIIEEDNFSPHVFLHEVEKLLGDDSKLESMREGARMFARPHAARVIAEEILKLAYIS